MDASRAVGRHARAVGRHQRRLGRGGSGRRRYQLRVRLVFQRCLMHIQQRTAASRENESLHEHVAKLWQDNQFLTARPPLPASAFFRRRSAPQALRCVPARALCCMQRCIGGDVPYDAHRLRAPTVRAGAAHEAVGRLRTALQAVVRSRTGRALEEQGVLGVLYSGQRWPGTLQGVLGLIRAVLAGTLGPGGTRSTL